MGELKKELSKRRAMESEVTRAIRVALAEKDMKWKDVAAMLDVRPSTVSTKKNGNSWTLKDLVTISRYLGVSFVIGTNN